LKCGLVVSISSGRWLWPQKVRPTPWAGKRSPCARFAQGLIIEKISWRFSWKQSRLDGQVCNALRFANCGHQMISPNGP